MKRLSRSIEMEKKHAQTEKEGQIICHERLWMEICHQNEFSYSGNEKGNAQIFMFS